MITEDYVSFETAKLLKEKGFDEECSCFYNNIDYGTPGLEVDGQLYYKNSALDDEEYAAPTLQMAMKWLREVHRLHVEVVPNPFNFEHQDIQDGWGCEVTHLSDLSYDGNYEFFQKKYSTYEEACEAAIKYCLENLLQI